MRNLALVTCAVVLVGLVLAGAGCQKPPAAAVNATPPQPTPPPAAPVGQSATEAKVYVPCGMIIPMRAVMDAFQVQNPGAKINGVFDNGPIIVKRLTEKREPGDLVVTPGRVEMDKMKAAGILAAEEPRRLGDFETVVIVPRNSKLVIEKPEDLRKCKTISSPNPDANSTGASGKEALSSLGLWDELQPRMILITHAVESHTMVASGKSDAGISYKNCPLETNPEKLSKSKVRVAFSFPEGSYEKQPCLIAKLANANELALKFLDFISSEEGLRILESKGMTGCLDMAEGATDAAAKAKTK